MRTVLNINLFTLLVIIASCSNGQNAINNTSSQHPSWQDNYYKYKTNKPDLPADKLFRLGFNPSDTALPVDKLKGVEIINANSTSLAYVPEDIKNLASLKSLNLTWTKLNYFPRAVFEMPQLVSVDFAFRDSSVTVDTLAYNFSKLPDLELLSLISCRLRDVPEAVTNLKRLKYLNLSQNRITVLSSNIGRLDSLIELDLSQNRVESLPSELSNLQHLEELNLYDNKLKVFPLRICQLSSLRELDFRYNDIKTLPNEILNLKSIQNLNFGNNPNLHITKEFAEQINRRLPNLKTIFLDGTHHSDKEMAELTKIFKDKIIFYLKD